MVGVMRRVGTALAVTGSIFVLACGAKTGLGIPEPTPVDAAMPPIDAPLVIDADPPECTVFGATAELLPLDVFMLFDASGSMHEPTPAGMTKWRAVRRAISRFFMDSESDGIGVALSFFPQVRADVPLVCESDPLCRTGGPCQELRACIEAGILCNTSTDCALRGFPDDLCVRVGYCSALGPDEAACTLDGSFPCAPGSGTCLPIGWCSGRDTCEPGEYERRISEVERLPDAAPALMRAYDAEEVPRDEAGGTPTLPAVVGTVDGALAWARANPSHKVLMVVATDGFPTSCDPDLRTSLDIGVGNVADAARRGVDAGGVESFVIGVFGPEERAFAQANLDRIATAGGTETAFIVNTAAGVTDEFLEALNQVRLDATACDFALSEPIPVRGERVWARITRDGRETWVAQVPGGEACAGGGFYFPDASDPAERIALCPATCALLGASPDREIELLTVCPDDPTEP